MAEGILGLGSSGSTGLNQELIDKLKAAEAKGKIDPYTTKLETWETELEKISEIDIKTKELLDAIKGFDLYSNTTNTFDQVTANTSGTSVVFDAVDVSLLTEGTNKVNVTQLAQRDVYQSAAFADKSAQVLNGNDSGDKLSVSVAGITYDFSTVNTTYTQLAEEISKNEKLTASVEQVGDASFRLVIKSTDTGNDNVLGISQTGVELGFGAMQSSSISDFDARMGIGRITINGEEVIADTEGMTYNDMINAINNYTDGGGNNLFSASIDGDSMKITALDGSSVSIIEDGINGLNFSNTSHTLSAQNMIVDVDGVAYDISSNKITVQGNLTITAVALGESTISLEKDTTAILPALEEFVTKYNELVTLVDEELYSTDSSLNDASSIRMMLNSIKDSLFGSYGTDDDKNIFSYGFSIDSSGHMSIDDTVFSKALTDDLAGLKSLFVGVAEKEGLATSLKTYLDELDGFDGLLTAYGDNMVSRKTKLEEDRDKTQASLDTKYSLLSQQFAAYTAIITQMEASFGGMKMMMDQSTA